MHDSFQAEDGRKDDLLAAWPRRNYTYAALQSLNVPLLD